MEITKEMDATEKIAEAKNEIFKNLKGFSYIEVKETLEAVKRELDDKLIVD